MPDRVHSPRRGGAAVHGRREEEETLVLADRTHGARVAPALLFREAARERSLCAGVVELERLEASEQRGLSGFRRRLRAGRGIGIGKHEGVLGAEVRQGGDRETVVLATAELV